MPTFEYTAEHDDGRTIRGTTIAASQEAVIQDLALKGMLVTKITLATSINDPIPTDFGTQTPPSTAKQEGTREAQHSPSNEPGTALPPSGGESVSGGELVRGLLPEHIPSNANTQPNSAYKNPYETPPLEMPREEPSQPQTDQRSYFATSVAGPLVGTVPLADLQMFFRQFASMQGAGVPLSKSLDTLSKQARVPKLSRVIGEMSRATEEGRPVSSVMQRYPEVFTAMMISLTRAGEEGGFLNSVLTQTADYIAQEIEIRNLWRKATLYPKIVIGASILIVLATNAIIASLGKTGGLTSPLTTSSVVVIVVPAIVILFLYLRIGNANPRLRYNWDAMTLKMPFLGPTIHMFAMSKFGRAFGALHKGGVPPGKALRLASDACGNEYIRSKLHPSADALERGDGIAGTLAETGVVSPIVLDMLQTGETSGNVDAMLDRAAVYFEEDAKTRSHQLAVTVGVLCLLAVAVYVGYIVVTFFMNFAGQIIHASDQSQGFLIP